MTHSNEDTVERGTLAEYHHCTRRVSVSLLYIAPLLTAHEIALRVASPSVRNAAELSVKQVLGGLGGARHFLLGGLALLIGYCLYVALKDELRFGRMFAPFMVEALLWALLLGPVISFLLGVFPLQGTVNPDTVLAEPVTLSVALLSSVGAGIYEELLFRFLALGGLFVILRRVFSIGDWWAVSIAVLVSAVAFSAYHHLGPYGEPWVLRAVLFRGVAGIILGVLFAFRGLGVVVYLHAWYDVFFDLRGHFGI